MGTAYLPSESLLTGGPRGHWYFRKGRRGPAPCLKAFPRTVIKGRFICSAKMRCTFLGKFWAVMPNHPHSLKCWAKIT